MTSNLPRVELNAGNATISGNHVELSVEGTFYGKSTAPATFRYQFSGSRP